MITDQKSQNNSAGINFKRKFDLNKEFKSPRLYQDSDGSNDISNFNSVTNQYETIAPKFGSRRNIYPCYPGTTTHSRASSNKRGNMLYNSRESGTSSGGCGEIPATSSSGGGIESQNSGSRSKRTNESSK